MLKQDKGKSGLADNECEAASPEWKAERIDRGIEILANGNGTMIDKYRLIWVPARRCSSVFTVTTYIF